ncbi:ElyC/SanA/YdcF family protein [Dactylosporangium sp. AC04546]|uniref:ElyC/SanA/YdcF family protein n=1 Tax=Dactylosporangium sp. AC04546 TaxID=2862460 RepID=UPI001EDE7912|nr:ElyC/SanA/YdcF family protein [Dactylosporangium sp. AC04546]WVK89170.1 ElyC/SanA/YdcF family protein [Dactylosporangium sp. AC04546]
MTGIPRVVTDLDDVPSRRLFEVVEAVAMIFSLPDGAADDVDALAVVIGQGETWRERHAIRLWESNPRLRHLLIADGNPAETTYIPLTLDGIRRTDGVELQPQPVTNTADQAAWIAAKIQKLEIRSVGLVVSPYHLPRVYLTLLQALGEPIQLLPVPVPVPPDVPAPETGATSFDLLPGEIRRIIAYREQGWVAGPKELREYLAWLWQQPLLSRTAG